MEDNPSLAKTVACQDGFKPSAAWILEEAREVYHSILAQLVQQDLEFRRLIEREVAKHPIGAEFVVATATYEQVWWSGLSRHHLEMDPKREYSVFDIYGAILDSLAREIAEGSFHIRWSVKTLLSKFVFKVDLEEKTLLLLSDSQCRQVKSIEIRDVVSLSGGKLSDMVTELEKRRVGSRNYRCWYLIINCGINIAGKRHLWSSEWDQLENPLMTEKNDSCHPRCF